MHAMDVPTSILARLDRCRTRRDMFQEVDPVRTAHVVVARQNGFVEPGAPVEAPLARGIVPDVNAIIRAVCLAGRTVIDLCFKTDSDARRGRSVLHDCMFHAVHRDEMAAGFGPDHRYFALWPEPEVQPADRVVDETRDTTFVPGIGDLDGRFPAAGSEAPTISGSLNNWCCESTARGGRQRDHEIIVVSDADAAVNDEKHDATLARMVSLFADVMPANDGLATITAATQQAA